VLEYIVPLSFSLEVSREGTLEGRVVTKYKIVKYIEIVVIEFQFSKPETSIDNTY